MSKLLTILIKLQQYSFEIELFGLFKRRSEDCSFNADGLIIEFPENTKLFIFLIS